MVAEQKILFHSYTPGCAAAQFHQPGSWATVTVDTVVLGTFQAACSSKITVQVTTFLIALHSYE